MLPEIKLLPLAVELLIFLSMNLRKILLFLSLVIPFASHSKEFPETYKELASLKTPARALKAIEYFVGTPTGINPLGEGSGVDPNPLISMTRFDCTTYVETMLAIAFSKDQQDIAPTLNKIRYRSDVIDFFQRNHFMVSDWIPANTKKGFVSEITEKLTTEKSAFQNGKKLINKTHWFFHRVIELLGQQNKSNKEILSQLSKVPDLAAQEENTKYLLSSYFRANEKAMISKLPDLSIVMFVRNLPSVPTIVNHMGFIIKKNGQLYLNHAPQARPWKVQEILLEDYFKDMDSHRAPMEGLLIFELGKSLY